MGNPTLFETGINHYLKGSVVAYHARHLEEVIAAEQGDLTDGEKAPVKLLKD